MRNFEAVRRGEWLELEWEEMAAGLTSSSLSEPSSDTLSMTSSDPIIELVQPQAGSHPHLVRQWLLARSLFPEKWINRLFSVGGIRWEEKRLQLLAFPAVNPLLDPLYVKAKKTNFADIPPILYEDDFCIVFNKPAGMPVHESKSSCPSTLDEAAAKHMLERNDPRPVRHIHRLDDDTSGPVLYSKNDLAQWQLDAAMREKRVDRHYIAIVQGRLEDSTGLIDMPIGKDRHHSARRRVTAGSDKAVTHYQLIEREAQASIVRLKLETGRTHQIRVHMSYLGHPLLGDSLYGGDTKFVKHQALHGERLLFPHPWTERTVEVEAPWPLWFEQLVDHIRS